MRLRLRLFSKWRDHGLWKEPYGTQYLHVVDNNLEWLDIDFPTQPDMIALIIHVSNRLYHDPGNICQPASYVLSPGVVITTILVTQVVLTQLESPEH